MLDPRGEILSDLLSGVILEAAQNVKSPEVLLKEMLMNKTLMGMLVSDLSEEEKLQCDFAWRSLDFETVICREIRYNKSLTILFTTAELQPN